MPNCVRCGFDSVGEFCSTCAPTPYTLRGYQVEQREAVRRAFGTGRSRVILCAPCGAGKTLTAADIMQRTVEKGNSCLFLAHQRALVNQASRKLNEFGISHGVIMRGVEPDESQPIQVASRDTLFSRAFRRMKMVRPQADLVIVDECHFSASCRFEAIMDSYEGAKFLGLTATPATSNGRGLGDVWESMVYLAKPMRLIEEGFLVPSVIYAPSSYDLRGVRVQGSDYVKKELYTAVDRQPKVVGDAVEHWFIHAEERPTVVFCTRISHSKFVCDEFRRAGVRAAHIDKDTPDDERNEIFRCLDNGDLNVVCNVDCLSVGWDLPAVSCVVNLRPTKSPHRYVQSCMRTHRPYAGKQNALILDHAGAALDFGFPEHIDDWKLTKGRGRACEANGGGGGEQPTIVCPQCYAVRIGGRFCISCGFEHEVKPKRLRHQAGKLKRFQGRVGTSVEDKQKYWDRCIGLAIGRNSKVGAAAHIYRQHFGVWPKGLERIPRGKEQWNMTAKDWYHHSQHVLK